MAPLLACSLQRKPLPANPTRTGGHWAPVLLRGHLGTLRCPGGGEGTLLRASASIPAVSPPARTSPSPALWLLHCWQRAPRDAREGRTGRTPLGVAEEKGSSGNAGNPPNPKHQQGEQRGAMLGAGKEPSGGRNSCRKGAWGRNNTRTRGPFTPALTWAASLGSNGYTGSRAEPPASFNCHYYYYNFVGSSKAAAFAQI